MHHTLRLTVLFVSALLCASIVYAQGTCNTATITGTYAFQSRGSSSLLAPEPQTIPLHWNGSVAPIGISGQVQIRPDRTVHSFYWGSAGSLNTGLTAATMSGKITELNPDCTGVVQFYVTGGTVAERFIVLDNGREIRSVTIQTTFPTGTWSTVMHRISNSPAGVVGSCGQHLMRGVYALRCDSLLLAAPSGPIVAGSTLFRLDVSATGEFTGSMSGKYGPAGIEPPISVSGKFVVNNDCTVAGTMRAMPGRENHARAVLYEGGREAFIQPLVTYGPSPGEVALTTYDSCQLTRVDR